MARRRHGSGRGSETAPESESEILRRRARRARGKGEHRKATVALRALVALEGDAKSWTLLGASLRRAHRQGEAVRALKQALYLHRQAGARLRARTVARMLVEIGANDGSIAQLAAC